MSKEQEKMLAVKLKTSSDTHLCLINEQDYQNLISGEHSLDRKMIKILILKWEWRVLFKHIFRGPVVKSFSNRDHYYGLSGRRYHEKFYYVDKFVEIQTNHIVSLQPVEYEYLMYSREEMLEQSEELLLDIYENNIR